MEYFEDLNQNRVSKECKEAIGISSEFATADKNTGEIVRAVLVMVRNTKVIFSPRIKLIQMKNSELKRGQV
jgi:hypothetical protein